MLGFSACIGRPKCKSPILIIGIPEWTEIDDVQRALLSVSEDMADVSVSLRDNNGAVWVAHAEVPIGAAIKLAEQKYLRLGWAIVG